MNAPTVIHGDCLDVLRQMPDNSIDAIVTDPPYGLSFMGKKWDYDVPEETIWRECLRVLKPGGHLLAFAGTRTQHRMAVRIEDAGFDIRDMIAWVYGSGFPKSHNLKGEFDGWGTALKPALEPITVARKPLQGTVAANVQTWGTGAMNIDGCRVGSEMREVMIRTSTVVAATSMSGKSTGATGTGEMTTLGRWPANLIHDGSEEVVDLFPESRDGVAGARTGLRNGYEGGWGAQPEHRKGYGGAGSAARFFYCAKASKADRGADNHHPTVKPTDLMRYLCRLVTPPGGTVLDPFCGSGSTGKAAVIEGFGFVGIERDEDSVVTARRRIAEAAERLGLFKAGD